MIIVMTESERMMELITELQDEQHQKDKERESEFIMRVVAAEP